MVLDVIKYTASQLHTSNSALSIPIFIYDVVKQKSYSIPLKAKNIHLWDEFEIELHQQHMGHQVTTETEL